MMFTDSVRSTTGRLCFDTCLSVCLSTLRVGTPARSRGGVPSQVWWGGGGGTPARSSWGGTPPGQGGHPTSGFPCQTWPGGIPHLGYPPSDLAGGTPVGRYPTLGTPLLDLAGGVPHLAWGYPTSDTPPSDLAGGTPPGWGVPHLG